MEGNCIMKNIESLPQFEAQVLDASELALVAGGIYNDDYSDSEGCSCTVSQCHKDGVTDSD